MKHILNDISSEERNNILEQHSGGKKMVIENFDKLVNNKLGTVKTFEEGRIIKEDNLQGGGLNATGRGVGYYRDQLGGVVKQNFTFGKDSMKTGSDVIDITKKEFIDLVNQLNLILSDSSIGQTTVTVTGGASAASKTPGYDNKALALRRANNLVTQLKKYIPGIDKKIKFTTKGVVDETATIVNSDKAYAAQFVKVSFQTSTITDIRQTIESDNTTVDPFERGGKIVGGDDDDNDGDKFPIPSTKLKRVCVKIPENRVADFRLKVREFKAEFGLDNIPFGIYDV